MAKEGMLIIESEAKSNQSSSCNPLQSPIFSLETFLDQNALLGGTRSHSKKQTSLLYNYDIKSISNSKEQDNKKEEEEEDEDDNNGDLEDLEDARKLLSSWLNVEKEVSDIKKEAEVNLQSDKENIRKVTPSSLSRNSQGVLSSKENGNINSLKRKVMIIHDPNLSMEIRHKAIAEKRGKGKNSFLFFTPQ